MKTKSTFLTLVFGLVVTMFACQDQSVVAPDYAISPDNLAVASGKPVNCKKNPLHPDCVVEPADPPTLQLGLADAVDEALVGFSSTDVTWKSKKGIFSMHAPFDPKIQYTGWDLVLDLSEEPDPTSCIADGPAGQALFDAFVALNPGPPDSGGRLTNIFFDEDFPNQSSVEHRIFVLVEGPVVRYYQFGSWYEDRELIHPSTFDRVDTGDVSTFTLTGGVLAIRDIEGPSSVTRIKCPLPDDFQVTVTLNRKPTS